MMAPRGAGSGMMASGVRIEMLATAPAEIQVLGFAVQIPPRWLDLTKHRTAAPTCTPPRRVIPLPGDPRDGKPAPASSPDHMDPRPHVSGGPAASPVRIPAGRSPGERWPTGGLP